MASNEGSGRRRRAPRLFIGGVILAGIVLGLIVGWQRRHRDALAFSGEVEAHEVRVGSLVGGRITDVHVIEGDAVEPGQLLVSIDPTFLDAQIAEQKARVAAAQAGQARVRAGPRTEQVERARIEWVNARTEARRIRALFARGSTTRAAFDDAEAAASTARQAYLEARRGSRAEDVASAQAALDQEQARLAYFKRQRRELFVSSPVAGQVETMDLRPGDLVAPSQPVASILEPAQLWVRVYVPEPKLGLVYVGQAASIAVDTFPRRRFLGRVVEIANQGEYTPRNIQTRAERNEQLFGVKVEIEAPSPLKPGMAATVDLEGARS